MDYKFKIFINYLYTHFQITLVHGLAIALAKGCALGLGLGCLKEFSWLIFVRWDKHIYNHFFFLMLCFFLLFSAKIITCKSCHHTSCFYPKS